MYLRVFVSVQEEVDLEGLLNVQILTKGFFPSRGFAVVRTEVVRTIKLEGNLKSEQKMYLDRLKEERVIRNYRISEFDDDE